MRFTIRGARLVDALMDMPVGNITIDGTHIQAVGHEEAIRGSVIDAANTIVTPGFIDVHTHGGGGFNLHTSDAEEIRAYSRWVPATGVTSFLIGVVGTPGALPQAQLSAAVAAIEQNEMDAEPLGIHLEGPISMC